MAPRTDAPNVSGNGVTFLRKLFTWPFFVGIGVGVGLTIGGILVFGYVVSQTMSTGGGGGQAVLGAPDLPADRAALPAYAAAPEDWTLRAATEDDSTTLGALRGQTVVVNLWATWCGPCKTEMPTLQALHDSTGGRVKTVLVSTEDRSTVRRFAEKSDYSMPMFVADETPKAFGGRAIPRTYIISPEGQVVGQHVGAADWNAEAVHRFLRRVNGPAASATAPLHGGP
jgi:thiol-disulfide isomerase/thioredoxin